MMVGSTGHTVLMWFLGAVLIVALAGPFPTAMKMLLLVLIVLVVLKNWQTYQTYFQTGKTTGA